MADGTQLKIADKNNFAEEDPFAELTRIMGFDPRQPVVRQDVGASAGRVEPAMDDDFGIDLEKELLGELAGDEQVAASAQPASYVQAEPVHQPEFEVDASFDDAFAASFEQGLSLENELIPAASHAYAEPVAYAQPNDHAHVTVDAPAYAQTHQPDFEVGASFDDAVAASFEQGMSLENELVAEMPAYAAAPRMAFEPEADFGSVERYATDGDHADEPTFEAEAPSVADEDVHYAAPVRSEAELDAEFDAAMADVDMDFAASDETDITAGGEMTLGGYEPAEAELAFSHHDLSVEAEVEAPAAVSHDYDEFERSLQSALSDEDQAGEDVQAFEVPVAAFEPVAEPVAAVPAAAEVDSLEDELNALLGTMSSQAKALSEPVVVPLRPEPAAVALEPVHSLWAAEQPVDDAQETYVEETAAYEPETYESQVHEVEDYADELAPVEAGASPYAEPTYDHQADDDVSFDDDAFDMALERSAEVAAPAAATAAAAIQPAAERPLAASRYEQARSWGLGTPVAPRAAPVVTAAPVAAAASSYAPAPSYEPELSYAPEPTYEPAASYIAEPEYSADPAYAQHEPEPFADEADNAADMHDDLEAELFAAVSSFDDAPEIETVDVPEKAVALADDLDIPELAFEDDTPPAQAFDDLDGEFSNLMNEMNAGDSKQPASSYASNPYAAGFDRKELREGDAPAQRIEFPAAAAAAVTAGAGAMYAGRQSAAQGGDDRLSGFDLGMTAHPAGRHAQDAADDFAYDPEFDEAMASSGLAGSPARPARRGMTIAAVVAAVAVVGGIGAWALSFGGSDNAGPPVLVKADDSPIKVRPENPGGITVPNQDSKVYDRVAGGGNGAPAQEKLVTNVEEPIDVAAKEAEALANDSLPVDAEDTADGMAPKSEERVAQVDQPDASAETAAVAPRKVRTMVVRPDGTLVPREEPAPAAVAAAEPTDPAPQRVAEPASEATGTVPAKPALAPVAEAKPAANQSASTPASAPIAPQRPSEQPVNVVGEVKPDQVVAVAPAAPTAAASGAWAMQIASQPSEAAAKSTYDDLRRRYGSVLNGREVSIVKAEIAGKGTFWRVRVPAGTRNDAVSLCESYKAAGGNCFVSK
ncbi:SPOR domain-containing protein [Aminobacter sp. HY435]|uniref:SPOR domain-containing protein n=1 Tax=Aminobacter sp. HY435 TaxID=2970917 RepID=UPI0022B9C6E3|nr:SPOR domain-containing protein [Aminobacter sp. HY435]